MSRRIILCGGNGSGKSTLGKALADAMGIQFMDNEDYYFPEGKSGYKYDRGLTREEFLPTLLHDMEQKFFDMVKGRPDNYAEEWVANLSCPVIRVDGTKSVKENVELLAAKLL